MPETETRRVERCWEIADRNIRHLAEVLRSAERGEGGVSPKLCRDQIDRWLDYRLAHGPDDEEAKT